MKISEFTHIKDGACSCGKIHESKVKDVIMGSGAVLKLCDTVKAYGAKKVFVLSDVNTFEAAGKQVLKLLSDGGIAYTSYVFSDPRLRPDDSAVGAAIMHFDFDCDFILTVGSGVLNDIGKIVSNVLKRKYAVVATAPSMDGYASDTSSMMTCGFKVSINSKCPDIIIGDTDILKNAPMRMLVSGLGDIIAKYVSICEWRISNVINGEYYCEKVASLMRAAVKKCADNAKGLVSRDEKAVEAVFEGLVMSGVSMAYVGASRPASGTEHYFSHIWDMRALEFSEPEDFHGIQCAIGTVMTVKLYEKLKNIVPDEKKALSFVKNFDIEKYNERIREFFGSGADNIIELEKQQGKYDAEKHSERLKSIINNYDEILNVISNELPKSDELYEMLKGIGSPVRPSDIGVDEKMVADCFEMTKDIRDKYILARLVWDIGVIDEFKDELKKEYTHNI